MVPVTLLVNAAKIGSSLTDTQAGFREVSGNIVLTADGEALRVPYLLVPRARAQVSANALDRFPEPVAATGRLAADAAAADDPVTEVEAGSADVVASGDELIADADAEIAVGDPEPSAGPDGTPAAEDQVDATEAPVADTHRYDRLREEMNHA